MRPAVLLVLLFACLTLLASCDRPFQHPTKSPNEWRDDHAQCEQKVRDALRNTADANDPGFEMQLINTCMQKKGWRKP